MAKPIIHARSSAKIFGGKPEDYLEIHQLIDSSRGAFPDLRHRTLTHNTWFVTTILPLIFGETRKNSDNREYSIRDIGERHVMEDFGGKFIPSAQDFLTEVEFKPWMDNGKGNSRPPSYRKLKNFLKTVPKQTESALKKNKRRRPPNNGEAEEFLPGCRGNGMID
ncbi:MAG TPA: hypothetical protein VFA52_03905 [Candidatus Paceibacterota bacterium]|nr:hypothetical protein [Candidatus Paceibacterota bacterium]